MADAGLMVLVTLISPKEADRQMAKEIIGDDLFSLVYVDTPLEVCEQRDPKGLYKKAKAGEIPNFTSVGAEFEEPNRSDYVLSRLEDVESQGLQKEWHWQDFSIPPEHIVECLESCLELYLNIDS